ncbi:unnamed protein product [Phyllotreta striolata]|uniref:Uncharacterized protein n=1 Tax=Phyllotreta striolata TaxID=444603 RepID=A0A9N9XQH3_PHYSR|nr:unnamed protein product [Phyllotreta striolata]
MTGTGAHERLKNKFVEDLGLESSIPLFLIQSRTWQNWSFMLVHDEQYFEEICPIRGEKFCLLNRRRNN